MGTSRCTSALGWLRYAGAGKPGVPVHVGVSNMCLGHALLCEEPFPHVPHQTLRWSKLCPLLPPCPWPAPTEALQWAEVHVLTRGFPWEQITRAALGTPVPPCLW